jgi:hypothetical protein
MNKSLAILAIITLLVSCTPPVNNSNDQTNANINFPVPSNFERLQGYSDDGTTRVFYRINKHYSEIADFYSKDFQGWSVAKDWHKLGESQQRVFQSDNFVLNEKGKLITVGIKPFGNNPRTTSLVLLEVNYG